MKKQPTTIPEEYIAFCRDCQIDRDADGIRIVTPDSPITAVLPADSPPTALAAQLARCFVLRAPIPLALVEDGRMVVCSRTAFEMLSDEPPLWTETGLHFGTRVLVRVHR
ncbi:hypothetical protein KR51_00027650 [Rubidibacter lacunae KORDI 51-2]|uniref:Uncharacterized protein n=1 Tax=Rubidibacter lacunae KORDI 51-2 TaxID=582515 RepID=U5DGP8_9CHRO|nr:hypothetical protein [Rubidibacter lacunae]ERN40776.1 hypothetical protein KR51_00027650 [Rubidibacter lacunae KORDI 51-2]